MRRLAPYLAILALSTVPAFAGEHAGVTMPDSTQVGSQTLVLNGMGLREKFFVDVYVAGLYLPAKSSDAQAILAADGARKTVMHFVHEVGKDKLCEGWNESLANNTPNASSALKADFAKLCAAMEDVAVGDQIAFVYEPGKGTDVMVKGASKATFAGKEFADALWASWIGPKPGPGEAFKQSLLGG
jgi:hypothetical protein